MTEVTRTERTEATQQTREPNTSSERGVPAGEREKIDQKVDAMGDANRAGPQVERVADRIAGEGDKFDGDQEQAKQKDEPKAGDQIVPPKDRPGEIPELGKLADDIANYKPPAGVAPVNDPKFNGLHREIVDRYTKVGDVGGAAGMHSALSDVGENPNMSAKHREELRDNMSRLTKADPAEIGAMRASLAGGLVAGGALRTLRPAATSSSPNALSLGDRMKSLAPQKTWSPELAQKNYLATAPQAAASEIQKLTPQQLRAIYPEGGAIPKSLDGVAGMKGFGDFAKNNPAQARALAESNANFAKVPEATQASIDRALAEARLKSGSLSPAAEQAARERGFAAAAESMKPALPKVSVHPTDPRYNVVERGPGSPDWMPQVQVRPKGSLDHNGAFHERGNAPGLFSPSKDISTSVPSATRIQPEQVMVNGQPLKDMNGVLSFGAHGGATGFQMTSTKRAADMVADQIKLSAQQGQKIDKVLLDSCGQRTARWGVGGSNAQSFERQLNQRLAEQGSQPVTVLAADRGGPLYGAHQRSWMGSNYTPATFTPAADGSKFYVSPRTAGVAAAAAAEGGYIIYREVHRRD